MDLQETCIGSACPYSQKCKVRKAKGPVKCPVYLFSVRKKALVPDDKGHFRDGPTTCPSCGEFRMLSSGVMYQDEIWGLICGYCLYEFATKGYPVNQGVKMLRSRGMDARQTPKAWDMAGSC